jgi:DNA polymerase (family 10)
VAQQNYGAALYYFTGSKAHNIQVRRLGQKRGLKINEYGVYRGKRRIAGKTEISVFKSVGLPYIPPELREGRGEIEAAYKKRLPTLVQRADLQGDLHCHSTATDGHAGIREMALAARQHGLKYLAITDHSQHLTIAHGLDHKRLLKQIDEIDSLNDELRGLRLLKGIEVDILADGSLDLPDQVLSHLDLVIGAVHSQFHLSRDRQTERILRAMDRPYFTMLAHPSGRLLQKREAYDVDMARIIKQARARGCFLELNSQPQRLDLNEHYCRMARDEGVLLSINSDAHTEQNFDFLQYGIDQARRGWLEKRDVLNTLPLRELRKLLQQTMG